MIGSASSAASSAAVSSTLSKPFASSPSYPVIPTLNPYGSPAAVAAAAAAGNSLPPFEAVTIPTPVPVSVDDEKLAVQIINDMTGEIEAGKYKTPQEAADAIRMKMMVEMMKRNGAGSGFAGLLVNGIAVGDSPPPNQQIALPGIGTVTVNEQTPRGNGQTTSGLTVNMIHVRLIDFLTGAPTGEIVVGSAQSDAAFVR